MAGCSAMAKMAPLTCVINLFSVPEVVLVLELPAVQSIILTPARIPTLESTLQPVLLSEAQEKHQVILYRFTALALLILQMADRLTMR